MAKSFLNKPEYANYPLGLRNNNPGNLVRTNIDWFGKVPLNQNPDPKFEQFYELRYGIRAKMRDVYNDIKKGQNTIQKLITAYAPPSENNTAAYIKSVATALAIEPTTVISIATLTEETLVALCKAIATMENGAQWAAKITDQDYRDALAIFGLPLKKKAVH